MNNHLTAPSAVASLPSLVALARALYPHDRISDAPYERAAARIVDEMMLDPELAELLQRGVADAERDLGAISESSLESRTSWLVRRQAEPFFVVLQSRVCFHLYDDREIWEHVGYPGPSYALGGYLHRGFDELPWLPDPRVEEPEEALVEIGPLPAREQEALS